ncbi:MAG: DHH family phosphoesterase [Chloroflexota bacterium]
MNNDTLTVLAERLKLASRVLVVSHIRPDGDAIGSLLGLGLALEAAGIDVEMALNDGIPHSFNHLPGVEKVRKRVDGSFDLVVVLDCSDPQRVGGVLDRYSPPDVNIDHHVSNLQYAKLNLVDTEAVATAEILARIFPTLGLTITKEVAAGLLTGLITDTIGFRTANVTPDVLRLAASLMEVGADLHTLYNRALVEKSFLASRYWGAGLANLQKNEGIVWTALSLEDRERVGYPGRDDADLINFLSAIEEAQIAIIFVQQSPDCVKVSWRSQGGIDVSKLAEQYGGGGHAAAAGAEIHGCPYEIQEQVLFATKHFLENEQGKQSE